MNIGDIFKGVSCINNSETKMINLIDLIDGNYKKDLTADKYVSQNKQNIISDKMSYNIFNKNNSTNSISNSIYIGYNYFITIINKEQYQLLTRFTNNYYLQYNNDKLNITSIDAYHNNIENNFIIVTIQVNNNDANYYEFDVIEPSMYLEYEQRNIEVSYEIDNIIHKSKIVNINENYITIHNNSNFKMGAPLFINNILLGIYYRKSANVSFFFRLSSIYSWLNTFSLVTKNRSLTQPLFIPYSKEQLYNILLNMNNRIVLLEKTIEKMKNTDQ